MGLYSSVINYCPALGPEFMGVLQTKQLDCMMDLYWLAPDGLLYKIDDSSTWTLEPSSVQDWLIGLPVRRVSTGAKGRVTPFRKSGVVRFTTDHQGEILETAVHFKVGQLTGVLCKGPIWSCSHLV